MKKLIIAISATALTIAVAQPATARAGEHDWAVAGRVLTGAVVAGAVATALHPVPVYAYTYPAPMVVSTPPAVCVRTPVVTVAPFVPVVAAPPVVYCPPQPVYVAPPVIVAPRAVVVPRVVFGRPHYYYHGYRRW